MASVDMHHVSFLFFSFFFFKFSSKNALEQFITNPKSDKELTYLTLV